MVSISALFGSEFQIPMVVALLTLLCSKRMPPPFDLLHTLHGLRLPRPTIPDSIVHYDFRESISERLIEVVRMYEYLVEILRLSLDEEARQRTLADGIGELNIGD